MCGRYQFSAYQNTEAAWIAEAVERKYGPGAWQPGDVHPGDRAPVLLVGDGDGFDVDLFAWGCPSRVGSSLVINARAETVMEKPMFRENFALRRCVIPATGFYERDARKRKFLFMLPETDTLYMAGLYDERGGQRRFCILTTDANGSVRDVHHRMPLVLSGDAVNAWLESAAAAEVILRSEPPPLESKTDEAQLSLW